MKNEDRVKTFLRVVGEDVGICQMTVSQTCHIVAAKIAEKRHIWLKFPQSIEAMEDAKAGWRSKQSPVSLPGFALKYK